MKNNIDVTYVDELIDKFVVLGDDKVCQAMRYSLESGGKRVRPLLLLNVCNGICGNISENAQRLAVALECVHTYSLIHDDLPCMDNDVLRRGKPTCHVAYGETAAVLAGDGLLSYAMQIALGGNFAETNYSLACKFLFDRCGVGGMILGQTLDIFGQTNNVLQANDVALHKTADLFRAAIVCGGITSGVTDSQLQTLDEIAQKLGVAFQVVDDLLDVDKCEKSFLSVLSKNDCVAYAEQLTAEALQLIQCLPYDLTYLQNFAQFNLKRTK